MRPKPLVRRLVIPALLVALVGWLAALEYHWLDEVSQADRNRRRASLQQHATEFAAAFDTELSRVYVMLASARASTTPAADAAFARRYDAWRDTAADPKILRAIYRASAAPGGSTLAQYDPAAHAFRKTAWPEALASVRAQLDRSTGQAPGPPGHVFQSGVGALRDTADSSIPAVITSVMTMPPALPAGVKAFVTLDASPDLMIGYFDRAYIETTLLPALAARFFPAASADPYRLAVIDSRQGDAPVMTSDWPAGLPIDVTHADASEPLFQLRPDVTARFLQRAVVSFAPSLTLRGTGAGGATDAPRSTYRIAVQETQAEGANARPASTVGTLRLTTRPGAGWRLILQHASGSLDAAVNRARVRNLWLSFGLLAVLAAGVVLIVTNAQRSEHLATQQMDFVATVSHELRTPLAVIRSAAQNLSAGVVEDPARARQYGALIDAEGRRLTEMVEQILDYAGMAGAARPDVARPVDLGRIAADVVDACAPLATAANVRVETEIAAGLPAVQGDPQALRSAIQNLVTNALKYGADGGWIGVDVRQERTGSKAAVAVIVRDRGLGVDAEDRRHLFEPFYRGRRAIAAQVRGNGLGLSLVKRIAEAHGGRVALSSEPGVGAAFTLTVPIAAVPAASSSLVADASASAK